MWNIATILSLYMYEVTMAAVIIYMYIIIVVNMTYTCTMYVLFRVVVGLHLVLFTQYNVYNSVSVAYICIIFFMSSTVLESTNMI